jgi:hypothetical protein
MGLLTPYETYNMFMSLKFHFSQKRYDFFRYNGKVNTSLASFEQKKDRWHYAKLSKIIKDDHMQDFLIANFLKDKKWVGEFLEDDAYDNYTAYLKRKQSLTYTFENELDFLLKSSTPKDLFKVKSGQYPPILQDYLSGGISLETLSIMNTFFCFDQAFDNKLGKDDVIWSRIRLHMQKLHPFLFYDKEKVKFILKSRILNT